MKLNRCFSCTCSILLLGVIIVPSMALPPIYIGGNVMYNSNTGERFWVKGITYGYSVADKDNGEWEKSLQLMAGITGLNAIRIYNVNPPNSIPDFQDDTSYDKFMNEAAKYGIYVMIPLTPSGGKWGSCTLNRAGTPPLGQNTCYPSCLLTFAQLVINTFSKYSNTLAFVVGNEVMNTPNYWAAAPCVKGFIKDIKQYMQKCSSGMRIIPLVYAAADTPGPDSTDENKNDANKMSYLECGKDPDAHLDMFGMNIYRWCSGEATYVESNYQKLNDALSSSPSPLILTEYGCRIFYYHGKQGERDWKQVETLFGVNMTKSWAGGMAYSYGQTGDGYEMYIGGSTTSPGYNKKCGYAEPPSQVCNVDNLHTEYQNTKPSWPKATGDMCNWKPNGYKATVPSCPVFADIDLTIPKTRQGADGYINVQCAKYSLDHLEKKINSCIKGDGLTIGAIVGIAIGSAIGVLLIAVGIWYFVRKKKSENYEGLTQNLT